MAVYQRVCRHQCWPPIYLYTCICIYSQHTELTEDEQYCHRHLQFIVSHTVWLHRLHNMNFEHEQSSLIRDFAGDCWRDCHQVDSLILGRPTRRDFVTKSKCDCQLPPREWIDVTGACRTRPWLTSSVVGNESDSTPLITTLTDVQGWNGARVEWVSSFLTAHQHIKGHSVP